MSRGLVLSLFPGIGMLDKGFEEEGFCVVRGPDLLWGGDIRRFHPPYGRFDGVIGGPPCQKFSPIGNVNRSRWGEDSVMPDLIPEFRRCVLEASPEFWVMENSPRAYGPFDGERYEQHLIHLDSQWLGEQQARRRCFWSNLRLHVEVLALVPPVSGSERAVSSLGSVDYHGSRAKEPSRDLGRMLELQGFPRDWLDHSPFTMQAKKKMVGNGVPLAMSRAIARAVVKALEARK